LATTGNFAVGYEDLVQALDVVVSQSDPDTVYDTDYEPTAALVTPELRDVGRWPISEALPAGPKFTALLAEPVTLDDVAVGFAACNFTADFDLTVLVKNGGTTVATLTATGSTYGWYPDMVDGLHRNIALGLYHGAPITFDRFAAYVLDEDNPDGYLEAGRLFCYPLLVPGEKGMRGGFQGGNVDPSERVANDDGSWQRLRKVAHRERSYQLDFLSPDDEELLAAMDDAIGKTRDAFWLFGTPWAVPARAGTLQRRMFIGPQEQVPGHSHMADTQFRWSRSGTAVERID
jgi:hypothetical protein